MPLSGWLLLLVVLALVGVYAARQRRPKRPAHTAPLPDADSLGSLGLSDIRPAGKRPETADDARFTEAAARPPATRAPDVSAPRPAPPRSEVHAQDRVDADGVSAVRPAARRSAGATLAPDAPWTGDAVPLLLASLAAHAGGRAVVVRHDGDRHHVVARSDRGVVVPVPGRPLRLDGPADLGPDDLGGLVALVGEHARALPLGDLLLLVEHGGPDADRYADLLAALTTPASRDTAPDDAPAEAVEVDDPRDAPDDGPAAEATRPVPRAEIIADEQRAAADAGRPLAFALVTLADAEVRLTRHTPEAVAVAEADLRDRLETAPDVRRVEPFGDLLFGAFLDLDAPGTARWCDALASGEPPLFIGAVAPSDGDPGAVRDAAAQALHDAYDQQRARVVEV